MMTSPSQKNRSEGAYYSTAGRRICFAGTCSACRTPVGPGGAAQDRSPFERKFLIRQKGAPTRTERWLPIALSLTGTPRSPSRPTEKSACKQKIWGRKGQSCHRSKRGKPVRGPRIATRIIERSTSYESIGDYWRPERFDVLGDPQLRNTESSRSTDDCAFPVLRGPKTCQKETHATVDKRGERSRR